MFCCTVAEVGRSTFSYQSLPCKKTIQKQKNTNSPSQVEPVELQKNLDHHRHAATKKSKVLVSVACFTHPCSLCRNLSASQKRAARATGLASAVPNAHKSINQILKLHKGAIRLHIVHQITYYLESKAPIGFSMASKLFRDKPAPSHFYYNSP